MTYIFLFLINISIAFSQTCVDENNRSVDWFIVSKIPKIHGNIISHQLINEGTAHLYVTSKNDQEWTLSSYSINDTRSIVGLTLKGLYSNQSHDRFHILYNDQPPNGDTTFTKGHTKGVLMGTQNLGFWLIHSVPHFPSIEHYYYPETGTKFGQSFLCLTIKDGKIYDEIGLQLQYNQPLIYKDLQQKFIQEKFPNLYQAINNVTVKFGPWYHTNYISKEIVSFAKHGHFNGDLYGQLVAKELNSSLWVETWSDGPGKMPSNCTGSLRILNVDELAVPTFKNLLFRSTHDHSKWAVTTPSSTYNWICIGDINRMESQKRRGGGTVCLSSAILAENYRLNVKQIEKCAFI